MYVGKKDLHNKWVYRLKEDDGGKKIFKAKLAVKGLEQKKNGIDFDEIFFPGVKMTSIRIVLFMRHLGVCVLSSSYATFIGVFFIH